MSIPEEKYNTTAPQDIAQQKLELEIADLRWKVKWIYKGAQMISIVSALIAIAAFMFGLYQFNSQQKENAAQQKENALKESMAYEREFKKPVWDRQLALLFEVSNVAATIAVLPPKDAERKRAETRFRQIYYGPMLFLDNGEKNADLKNEMLNFANCLDEISEECSSEELKSIQLQKLSLDLTTTCQNSINSNWGIKFNDHKAETSPTSLP